MKRILSSRLFLLLGFVAIMVFAVACGDDNDAGNSNTGGSDVENNNEAEDENAEPTELEIVINDYGRTYPNGMDENDNPYIDYIEENTNIDLKVQTPPSSGYMERLNVLMAGEDLPDMIYSPDPTW